MIYFDVIMEFFKALLKDYPDLISSKRFKRYRFTPLHMAAQMGHKDIVELLLVKKAKVNAKNIDGSTPLHCAAQRGYMDVAELLLANNADVNARDERGWTPLHDAIFNGHKNMVELLRQHGGYE